MAFKVTHACMTQEVDRHNTLLGTKSCLHAINSVVNAIDPIIAAIPSGAMFTDKNSEAFSEVTNHMVSLRLGGFLPLPYKLTTHPTHTIHFFCFGF